MNKIIFLTGAEGVGKTSIINILKQNLKDFEIFDFDEVSVPENPPLNWRYETTKHWLKIGEKNLEKNKSTLICGLTIPKEIDKFSSKKLTDFIYIGLLDIEIKERENRLRKRGADQELINDTKCLILLKNEFNKSKLKSKKIIDTTNLSILEVCETVTDWIKGLK